jgi:hypothetical protein
MTNPPKVFVSHASEDRERFVRPFATRLREHGVDAWLSFWEMVPGDRLVEKIFEDGLKPSDAVIVVLSEHSVDKPWVREELDYAVVRNVEEQVRLIPVRLENCLVPECVRTTMWIEVPDVNSFEPQLNEIVNAVFGRSDKPPLGTPPRHILSDAMPLEGLTPLESTVLEAACRAELQTGFRHVDMESFTPLMAQLGMSEDQVIDVQNLLEAEGFIKLRRKNMTVLPLGFDIFARTCIADYQEIVAEVGRRIIREEAMDNKALADGLNQPLRLMTHVLHVLESKEWIRTGEAYAGGYDHVDVLEVSPLLKRWLERR